MEQAFAITRFHAALAVVLSFVVAGSFDPGRDLPGCLEAFLSPDNDLYSFDANALLVANAKSGRTHVLEVPQAVLEMGHDYRIALESEKSEFVFSVDGEMKLRAPDGGIGSLRLIMLSHGNATFEVSDLVLTGALDPALLEEKRAAFVAERRAMWTYSE